MECEVKLPPELGLDSEAFTDVWNSLPRCSREAQAETVSSNADRRTATVLKDLTEVPPAEELLPLLRTVLEQLGVREQVAMKQITNPDGSTTMELHTLPR